MLGRQAHPMDLLIAEAVQNIVMCSSILLLHAATAPAFIGFGPHWGAQGVFITFVGGEQAQTHSLLPQKL